MAASTVTSCPPPICTASCRSTDAPGAPRPGSSPVPRVGPSPAKASIAFSTRPSDAPGSPSTSPPILAATPAPPPAGAGDEYSGDPDAARPPESAHHPALHPRGHHLPAGDPESARSPARSREPVAAHPIGIGVSAHALRADRLELADIVRAHAGQLSGLSGTQRRVVQAITTCRTAALGGHRRACAQCGHQEIAYNSCRDRHCPKCQGLEAARWMDAQQRDLLPVPYFHVVFTVPAELHALFLAPPKATYPGLFAAVAETLTQGPRRRLGAQIAVTAILHTWTQLLLFPPHIHCIVPGGGLDPGDTPWIAARADFFLPVRILPAVFRRQLPAPPWRTHCTAAV